MATLAVNTITRAGVLETLVAATGGGDAAPCNPDNYLKVNNGGGSPITVTLAIPAGATGWPGIAYANSVITVTNGTARLIGPLLPAIYQDPITGLCTITYSAVTSVTVGVFCNLEP